MRPAVLLLAFAVCNAAPPAKPVPAPDPLAALEASAARQARRGAFGASSDAYRRMAALGPTSPARCRWQVAVFNNTLAAGNKRDQVEELLRFAALDRTFAADWTVPADAKQACHRALHDTLAEVVYIWNKEMTMGCTAYSWDKWPLLETLFHEFLADFPGDPWAPEARRQLERLQRLKAGESRSAIDQEAKR